MNKNPNKNKSRSPLLLILVTAVITLVLAGSGAYFMGYLPSKKGETPILEEGKKIAYWRAPMNPTEIYDQPGKSAMGMELVPVYEDEQGNGAASGEKTERRIAYWRAPMNPTEIYDKAGKSTMGMDLVPVYEDELIGGVEIGVDPVIQQNMGLRTAVVAKGPLIRTIRTYGHITYDETRMAEISPKISGWIEKIHADFQGIFVKKGDPLFELYSPQLFAAQEEYLVTYRNISQMSKKANNPLLKAARRRLSYFDVADSEIREMENSGEIRKTVIIRSPFDGAVILKNASQGSFVKEGTTVYKIADLSHVWVDVHIFEYELPFVMEGQLAEMTLPYLPGQKFSGKISYVYPYLQKKTRDVVIRLEFENRNMLLKPDMYADIEIKSNTGVGLTIPSEAFIRSGERNIVFVARDKNKFTPRDVTLGLHLDKGNVQVLTGLAPGETVVISGQFLLDSESKLKEAVQKMLEVKREKIREKVMEEKEITEEREEDFFKDFEEEEEDFFKDFEEEEEEDFYKDLEEKVDQRG